MMKIYYESNEGVKLDLLKRPYRLQTGDLFHYKWDYESTKYSGIITNFKKGVQEKKLTIAISSSNKLGYYDAINHFFETTEKDIMKGNPGKLYVGNQFLYCYIYGSEKTDWECDCDTLDNDIFIVAESAFWITEEKTSFEKYNGNGSNQFLNYPYNFPYNYTSMRKGFSKLKNEHYAPAHFLMTIYGPAVNPMVIIGGHTCVVNTTIRENEYLEIDSRNKSAIRTLIDGTKVNEFNNRGQRIFERIPPGELTVNWSGEFGFDIVLYYERSEPKWIQG